VSRRRSGDSERGDFADALPGVRPLAGRKPLRPPPQPPDLAPASRNRSTPRRLLVESSGEALAARADDVSRAQLAKLRRGDPPPEREVDLHGLSARDAERRLAAELAEADLAGVRCLLVIHGRGIHSQAGAVLRDALPGWLARSPHAERLMAFATAPRSLGGPGATLVLLRRARARTVSSEASRRPGRGNNER
jgi:DNA-nicking Smr family endonuclease